MSLGSHKQVNIFDLDNKVRNSDLVGCFDIIEQSLNYGGSRESRPPFYMVIAVRDNRFSRYTCSACTRMRLSAQKNGHLCPPTENEKLRSQLPKQNDLLNKKLTIFMTKEVSVNDLNTAWITERGK